MILRDSIGIVTALSYKNSRNAVQRDWGNPVHLLDVPAYVGFESTALNTAGGTWQLKKQVRVIMEPPPFELVSLYHRIRWNGTVYVIDGVPMPRKRNGEDFYLSLMLE